MHYDNLHNPGEEQARRLEMAAEVSAPPSLLPTVLQRLGLDNSHHVPLQVSLLPPTLTSPTWYQRAEAVRKLGLQGPDIPLQPLIAALHDEHTAVRIAAIHALSTLGIRAPIDHLLFALHDHEWLVREAAVLALDKLGGPPESLQYAQHDQDSMVREAARSALQHARPSHVSGVPIADPFSMETPLPCMTRAELSKTSVKNTFSWHLPQMRKNVGAASATLQETDNYAYRSTIRSYPRRPQQRLPKRPNLGPNLALGFAIIVVLVNIVAWSVIAQKLHPSFPSLVGAELTTPTLMASHLPIFSSPLPSPRPISANVGKTLYSYQCPVTDDMNNLTHLGDIDGLAWTSDSKRIASICVAMGVQAWDATTGKHLVTYEAGLGSSSSSVNWSPDNKRIMVSAQTAQIWDASSSQLLVTYQPALLTSGPALAQPNPKALMTAFSGGNQIYDSVWSPDGTMIASAVDGNAYGYNVQVWNAQTGNHLFTLQSKDETTISDNVAKVAWSPDGTRIAFTVDGTVQIWDVATKKLILSHPANTFAWSPDGTAIASDDTDGSIHIWNVTTGKTISIYRGQMQDQSGISSIAWSPDGTRIASGSSDVQIWDAATTKKLFIYKDHGSSANTYIAIIRWSPDGKMIASAEGSTARVWLT